MRRTMLAALLLAACGEDDPYEGLPADVRCYAEDGLWECADEAMELDCRCARGLEDAGAECVDSAECEGLCVRAAGGCGTLEAVGTCQEYDTRHACFEELYLGRPWPPPPEEPIDQLRDCRNTCGE